MWLLSTSRAELKFFADPTQVRYAILSHVWRENEQSFQDIQLVRVRAQHASLGNPRDHASEKIRRSCIFAERHGFEWIWVDTCCIDKTSSAELSEAINSMYAWYANAEVCYAFLDDVDDDEDPSAQSSSHAFTPFDSSPFVFRRSRWFTRGWTLQELLAPTYVVFLSRNWRTIGTKHGLARLLEEVTGVDRDVLRHKLSLDNVSIAKRMSWAARRQTTRMEDRAYSLMGLFGVHMPTIYGEGAHAFIRLQQEIIKQSSDQSIFAWGRVHGSFTTACETASSSHEAEASAEAQALFAPSPDAFAHSAKLKPLAVEDFLARFRGMRCKVPEFYPTSYGMRTALPLVSRRSTTSSPTRIHAAVLACEDDNGALVLLFLRRQTDGADRYLVGAYIQEHFEYCRAGFLPPDEQHPVLGTARVAELYIHMWNWTTARRTAPVFFPGMHGARRIHRPHVFFLPHWVLARMRRYGLEPDRTPEDGLSIELHPCYMYDEETTASLSFTHRALGVSFTLTFGQGCSCSHWARDNRAFFKPLWIAVAFDHAPERACVVSPAAAADSGSPGAERYERHVNSCSHSHLSDGAVIQFGSPERRIEVELMKWEEFHSARRDESVVHVLDVRLVGSSYAPVYRRSLPATVTMKWEGI